MSIEDALTEVQKKRLEEEHLFNNFEKYYEKRDLVKASEFLWGSVSKIVYFIGLLYGKKCGKHKEIVLLLEDLARDNPETNDWISSAEALHSNFYHNWMDDKTFENNVRKVAELRDWLDKTLNKKIEEIAKTPIK